MKRLKRAIYNVDRFLTGALPGLQNEESDTISEDSNESRISRPRPRKVNMARRGSLLPMVVQRRNPLGKKAPVQKALQKLNAVSQAPVTSTFTLPVKSSVGTNNKKPLATGPPKKSTRYG